MSHRRLDPYSRARDAARDLARADPRNRRLHEARSLPELLPAIALYPLQAETLLATIALGVGLWLGTATVLGLWLLMLVGSALVVYWLEIVAASANGYGAPPRLGAAAFGRLGEAGQAILPVAAAVTAVGFGAARDLPLLLWGGLLGGALLLPALLVLISIEGSLITALDPRRWSRFLTRGGPPYYAVVVLAGWQLLRSAGVAAPDAATEVMVSAERAGAILADLLRVYLAFAGAHLLGVVVYLRREALGFQAVLEGRSEAEDAGESLQESVARLLALADAEEHHGRDEAAVRLLATEPIGSHAARPWLEELFEGACRRPKPYFAEAAGQRLVAHLCAERQLNRALEIVVLAAQRWPRFQPAALDDRQKLAVHALERGAALAFRQLTERLEAIDAAPQAVELGFLAARWRAERDGDAAGALALLEPLARRAGHPAARRIAAYAAALEGGRGGAPAPPRQSL